METQTIPHIVIRIPTRDTPGYFKRQKRIMEYAARWKARDESQLDPAIVEEMIELFADYVTEPEGHEAATAALWEASEAQLEELLNLFQNPNAGSPAATNNGASTAGRKGGSGTARGRRSKA